MIKKTKNCIYCGNEMESVTAKKKYCSDLCRVYFNREKNSSTKETADDTKNTSDEKDKKEDDSSPDNDTNESTNKENGKHPLWENGDPKEGSMAFMNKYGCCDYNELEIKKKEEIDEILE